MLVVVVASPPSTTAQDTNDGSALSPRPGVSHMDHDWNSTELTPYHGVEMTNEGGKPKWGEGPHSEAQLALLGSSRRAVCTTMDESLYNGMLAALEAVHGSNTTSEVRV